MTLRELMVTGTVALSSFFIPLLDKSNIPQPETISLNGK